jgi:hypothetical protein
MRKAEGGKSGAGCRTLRAIPLRNDGDRPARVPQSPVGLGVPCLALAKVNGPAVVILCDGAFNSGAETCPPRQPSPAKDRAHSSRRCLQDPDIKNQICL